MGIKNKPVIVICIIFLLFFSCFITGDNILWTTSTYKALDQGKYYTAKIPRDVKVAKYDELAALLSPLPLRTYTITIINKMANAASPLSIKTYDGHNQPIHPDILYIDKGFNGYKYWMAYTPYPNSLDLYENPCIAASNDGISWSAPKGLKNPVVPPPHDIKSGGHNSDTDIIYDNGRLYIYFVHNKKGIRGPSTFFRVASNDGILWSEPELIYETPPDIAGYSPAVVKENNGYRMWYTSDGDSMLCSVSSDGIQWDTPQKCNIQIKGWTIWHIDVIKTDIGYEGLLCAINNDTHKRALFYVISNYGITWESSLLPIIYPSDGGWDSFDIYRATMLKQNGLYRIWYSARNHSQVWHIGYTEGKSIDSLQGYGLKKP